MGMTNAFCLRLARISRPPSPTVLLTGSRTIGVNGPVQWRTHRRSYPFGERARLPSAGRRGCLRGPSRERPGTWTREISVTSGT